MARLLNDLLVDHETGAEPVVLVYADAMPEAGLEPATRGL